MVVFASAQMGNTIQPTCASDATPNAILAREAPTTIALDAPAPISVCCQIPVASA